MIAPVTGSTSDRSRNIGYTLPENIQPAQRSGEKKYFDSSLVLDINDEIEIKTIAPLLKLDRELSTSDCE